MGGGDDVLGEVEPLTEELNTIVGECVVVVLPRELGLDVALGVQGLHGLNDVEVLDGDSLVLLLVEVLLSNANTLLEEILVDSTAVGGRDVHSSDWRLTAWFVIWFEWNFETGLRALDAYVMTYRPATSRRHRNPATDLATSQPLIAVC